jgi:hypothetical protein
LKYVFVGTNLFSTTDITEPVTIEVQGIPLFRNYTIAVEKVGEFLLDDLNALKMEDHPVALNFINSIIKSALRNSTLKQIGRSPLFFMPKQAKDFNGEVATWPGFFTSSWVF